MRGMCSEFLCMHSFIFWGVNLGRSGKRIPGAAIDVCNNVAFSEKMLHTLAMGYLLFPRGMRWHSLKGPKNLTVTEPNGTVFPCGASEEHLCSRSVSRCSGALS